MGGVDRVGRERLWHPLDAPDQADFDLPANPNPPAMTLESTVRYPGIEVDDALEIAEQTDAYRDRSVGVAVGWPLTDQDQRVSRASIADVVR